MFDRRGNVANNIEFLHCDVCVVSLNLFCHPLVKQNSILESTTNPFQIWSYLSDGTEQHKMGQFPRVIKSNPVTDLLLTF